MIGGEFLVPRARRLHVRDCRIAAAEDSPLRGNSALGHFGCCLRWTSIHRLDSKCGYERFRGRKAG